MDRLTEVKWCLLGCLIILILFTAGSVFIPGRLTDSVAWLANSASGKQLRTLALPPEVAKDGLIEMEVETVGFSEIEYQPVVILKKKGGELYLPIVIGLLEANAISIVLEGFETPRPITADLLCSFIDKTGASVDYIVINDLKEHTFYATVVLNANWKRIEVDARPSDAVALALRVRVPIYAASVVLEKAGLRPHSETDRYTSMAVEKDKVTAVA